MFSKKSLIFILEIIFFMNIISAAPFDIPIDNGNEACAEGCLRDGRCVPLGYRMYEQYCSIDGIFKEQKQVENGISASCDDNYECVSNLCSNGKCVELRQEIQKTNKFKRFISKKLCIFSSLFSPDTYEQCVAKYLISEGRCSIWRETDRGINSVLKGDLVLADDDSEVKVASDACIDSENLNEYYCDDDEYFYGRDWNEGTTRSLTIKCPYGCANGGCLLGQEKNFCISQGNCIELNEQSRCESKRNYNLDNPFTSNFLRLTDSKGQVNLLEDSCVSNNIKRSFYCSSFVITDDFPEQYSWEGDKFKVPKSKNINCPNGYSCLDGKCLENERALTAQTGDVNRDGGISGLDLQALSALLAQTNIPYSDEADIDKDGMIDDYDLYRLNNYIIDESLDIKHPIREFILGSISSLYQYEESIGSLKETQNAQTIRTWNLEYKEKGGSRRGCFPPILNINFKVDDIPGISTYSTYKTLRYDKFRMLPDCDVWGNYDADNLIREYFIYWLFRDYGVPASDTIAFAKVKLESTDNIINHNKYYNYIFLQRDNSNNDQYPFRDQYGFKRIIEASDTREGNVYYEYATDLYNITFNTNGAKENFLFEMDNSLLYSILTDFIGLSDRNFLHNEDYGVIDSSLGEKIMQIPFDFDASFNCGYGSSFEDKIDNLPLEIRQNYKNAYYQMTKIIFDNPDNLNIMLTAVDKYPFRANKIKVKNDIKLRFYANALYYGSQGFASKMDKPYVPFTNHNKYIKEARRIMNLNEFDSLCSKENYLSNFVGQ